MEIKINDLNSSEKEIEVTLTYDEIKSEIESEVLKKTRQVQIPGFRKGKAPASMIKRIYGDSFDIEASEKVANAQFWKIADEKHLHPIGQPALTDIKFEPRSDLYFKVKYEVIPELEVKGYTGQEIEIPKFTVKDEDVDNEIKYILKSNSTSEDAEIITEDNNYVIDADIQRIDKEGNPYQNSKPERMKIDLSDERVMKDIKESSRDKKVGESFSFGFTDTKKIKNEKGEEEEVPEDYNYEAEIKEIKKTVIPEMNEEFIKKVSKDKASTEAELRANIKKDIEHYYEHRIEDLTKDKIIGLIIKNNDFTPPTILVNNMLEEYLKREEEYAKKEGHKKFDRNEASKRLHGYAENEVKWYLLRNSIIKKENIEVSDEELNDLAAKDSEKTGIPVEKLINYYKTSNYKDNLLENRLFDFLKANNTIKEVDINKKAEEIDEQ